MNNVTFVYIDPSVTNFIAVSSLVPRAFTY